MIIVKTPLRVSFFGGGTDFPAWYKNNGGMVISSSINKYCYILLRNFPPFFPFKYRLRYHQTEIAKQTKDIKHPVIREVLKKYHKKNNGLEIFYFADVPALSGLGSSSAFTVSMINVIHAYNKINISKKDIANKAIYLEQIVLKENVGSQDQIATSYGGFNYINFKKQGFEVTKSLAKKSTLEELQSRLVLIYSNYTRKSDNIESSKIKNLKKNTSNYSSLLEISLEAKKIFESNNNNFISELAILLNESWKIKKKLSKQVSNNKLDEIYNYGIKNGAIAGKLLGAGSGGFFLFLTRSKAEKNKLINSFKKNIHVNFNFENLGTSIILNNENKDDYYEI
jgi:D-glycero-alpha-D-manno-heptose-7-phosphate kinase